MGASTHVARRAQPSLDLKLLIQSCRTTPSPIRKTGSGKSAAANRGARNIAASPTTIRERPQNEFAWTFPASEDAA